MIQLLNIDQGTTDFKNQKNIHKYEFHLTQRNVHDKKLYRNRRQCI